MGVPDLEEIGKVLCAGDMDLRLEAIGEAGAGSIQRALDFLQSDNFVSNIIRHALFGRGLPPKKVLQDNPSITQFLQKVLTSNQSEDNWQSNHALEICYRHGWLQAELSEDESPDLSVPDPKTVYVFTSALHRR